MAAEPSYLDWRYTDGGEPHVQRREEILARHPEIKKLYGFDRRINLWSALVVITQLGIAWGLAAAHRAGSAWGSFGVTLAVSWLIGAIANHYGGVVIHEASHNLCARTSIGNYWAAIFANIPVVVPSAMTFRRDHMTHHRYMGIHGKDNDLPGLPEVRWVGNSPWRKIVWLSLYSYFGVLGRGFWHKPNKWEWIGFVFQMAINVGVVLAFGWWAMLYLYASTFFGYGLHPVAGHFIQEHYLWDENQETYSYYGILNQVTRNMGYHNEHHDFMSVPGSRLPELYAMAPEFYAPLVSHKSWAWVMWYFVKTPRLSHFSRLIRSEEIFRKTIAVVRARHEMRRSVPSIPQTA